MTSRKDRVPAGPLRGERPVCVGSGLITLDVIYDNKRQTPEFSAGGSCCNVLTILAYMGWNSFPMAILGADPEGDKIVGDMEMWGVKTKFVERNQTMPSPRIIQRMTGGETPSHHFHMKCEHGAWLPRRRPLSVRYLESMRDMLPHPDIFYFDRADPGAIRAATLFKEWGAVIVFEPPRITSGGTFSRCLEVADILKCCGTRHDISDARVPLEIRTNGECGLEYRASFLGRGDWTYMKAFPVTKLVDAAGSGDWLTAGFIHSMMCDIRGMPSLVDDLERSLAFGQALASLNCGFVGAQGMMRNFKRAQAIYAARNIMRGNLMFTPPHVETSRDTSGCRACLCSSPDARE